MTPRVFFKVIIVRSFPKSSFVENDIFKTHPIAFWSFNFKIKIKGPLGLGLSFISKTLFKFNFK